MSEHSKIEWTEATWNPVRGCVKVSPGCKHCYAETFAERFRGVAAHPYELGFDPRIVPSKLLEPLTWTSPKTVFVNSMSDLFQDAVPDDYIAAVLAVMLRSPWHTYQVLTKRSKRMARLLSGPLRDGARAINIWWGVSVEDRKYGVPRIDDLRQTPAKVRFLSIEPLLEDLGKIDLRAIEWVIVGGESGAGARKMEKEWVEAIRQACLMHGTQFFFKQWGGVQKAKYGRELDGRTYDGMPHLSSTEMPSVADRRRLLESLSGLVVSSGEKSLVQIDHDQLLK
jgi:protein gp37